MALDTAYLDEQKVFAAKIETTTGTPIALSGTDGAWNAFNSKLDQSTTVDERQGQGTMSPLPSAPGAIAAEWETDLELVGDGSTINPPVFKMFSIGGMAYNVVSSSGVLTPLTDSPATATVGLWEGAGSTAHFKSAAGCMTDWTIKGQAGHRVMCNFKGKGVWQAPVPGSPIAPTYPIIQPPRLVNSVFTIGGTTFQIGDFEINGGMKVILRQQAGTAAGYKSAWITHRRIMLKVSPETTPLSVEDWDAAFIAQTSMSLVLTIGAYGSHNAFEIFAPNMTINASPKDAQRDGILTKALEFQLNRSSSAGDDELKIQATV